MHVHLIGVSGTGRIADKLGRDDEANAHLAAGLKRALADLGASGLAGNQGP